MDNPPFFFALGQHAFGPVQSIVKRAARQPKRIWGLTGRRRRDRIEVSQQNKGAKMLQNPNIGLVDCYGNTYAIREVGYACGWVFEVREHKERDMWYGAQRDRSDGQVILCDHEHRTKSGAERCARSMRAKMLK